MNIPSSTYRVQLHKGFTFRDLKNILDYLRQLGVSTIYAAPILKSRENSMHGYDVVDPHEIDPEIGTMDELREIAGFLKDNNMTWLQDIVPNHMAFDASNWRLMDVFERGPASPYYRYFDIDWNHPASDLREKVMVPFLGKELSECIEGGEIKLSKTDDGLVVSYFDTSYPLSMSAYRAIDTLREAADVFMKSPASSAETKTWRIEKRRWTEQIDRKFDLNKICDHINNSKEVLHDILRHQYYVLTYWKRSEHEINYRRFFTVNELICLRMEDERVFDEYHVLIAELYKEGLIQGVRIDHVDGLQDPSAYVAKLRVLLGPDCYIIAEKILESKETIPETWPIEGTSGYEFLSFVSQLVTDRQGARKLLTFYHELVPELPPYQKLVVENKKRILENHMHGEWENLVNEFTKLKLANGYTKDAIKDALGAVMISMPVYRIYPQKLPLEGSEKSVMNEAFQKAVGNSERKEEVRYLEHLMVDGEEMERSAIITFEKRLMQFTGPLTAKGVEDTTFYVYNPLISHDEVGDAPSTLGISIQEFHTRMEKRSRMNPISLNATATHDTKRGEDARLRLNVLSEMPDIWIRYVKEWVERNQKHKTDNIPSINDEYFIYQSLVGGYPHDGATGADFITRIHAFLTKAIREAKQYSSWSDPNEAYEQGCLQFVSSLLEDESFMQDFKAFVAVIDKYSQLYSLVQVVVKATAPGIPDIYQGCELWDLSFVDPDNRRPVDFNSRMQMLKVLQEKEREGYAQLLSYMRLNRTQGFEKLFVSWKVLSARSRFHEVFAKGEYIPLQVKGELVMAYVRRQLDQWILVAVPLGLARNMQADQPYADDPDDRKFVRLPPDAPKTWRNIFTAELLNTDGKLYLFEAFKDFPVAVMVGED